MMGKSRNAVGQWAGDADGDDIGSALAQPNRMRTALATGGAGDDSDLAGQIGGH
jgi:hypothetical protein